MTLPYIFASFWRLDLDYTRYEKARMVGARALQIAMGAPLLIDPGNAIDPVEIAMMEFEKGVIPMTVKRKGKRIKGPVA